MSISIFDLFSIGIGPSSSHTMGPMRAAAAFVNEIEALVDVHTLIVELYGSLALTGKGHGTDKAIILGLEGYQPETIDPAIALPHFEKVCDTNLLALKNEKVITFDPIKHLLFFTESTLQTHTNGMRFFAFNGDNRLLLEKTYFSIGGGFIVDEDNPTQKSDLPKSLYFFESARDLLNHCKNKQCRTDDMLFVWKSGLACQREAP